MHRPEFGASSSRARGATTTIPVVFPNAINPVETGVVASLARSSRERLALSRTSGDIAARVQDADDRPICPLDFDSRHHALTPGAAALALATNTHWVPFLPKASGWN